MSHWTHHRYLKRGTMLRGGELNMGSVSTTALSRLMPSESESFGSADPAAVPVFFASGPTYGCCPAPDSGRGVLAGAGAEANTQNSLHASPPKDHAWRNSPGLEAGCTGIGWGPSSLELKRLANPMLVEQTDVITKSAMVRNRKVAPAWPRERWPLTHLGLPADIAEMQENGQTRPGPLHQQISGLSSAVSNVDERLDEKAKALTAFNLERTEADLSEHSTSSFAQTTPDIWLESDHSSPCLLSGCSCAFPPPSGTRRRVTGSKDIVDE